MHALSLELHSLSHKTTAGAAKTNDFNKKLQSLKHSVLNNNTASYFAKMPIKKSNHLADDLPDFFNFEGTVGCMRLS